MFCLSCVCSGCFGVCLCDLFCFVLFYVAFLLFTLTCVFVM